MDRFEPAGDLPQTHIVKWTDGEHAWSMVIKPGKVDLFTTAPVPEQTLRSQADQWGEAFDFIDRTFKDSRNGNRS